MILATVHSLAGGAAFVGILWLLILAQAAIALKGRR